MKSRKFFVICAILVLLMLTFTSCVPGDGANSETNLAGFFTGVWHGWIAPISLILSIFNNDIGI